MKLQQLRYVVKVAECGSITEASRRLFVSQPSITASIRDLENEMGVRIFERTNKGVVVSEEGETFLGYARQVLDQADLLEGKYKGASEQVPHFSVSCQHYSFAVNAFVDLIKQYGQEEYDFSLRETQTYEIIENVNTYFLEFDDERSGGFASCEIGNKLTEDEQWAKIALVKRIAERVWK